jgi:thiol-disulfide isomerase/thioredoxin
MEKLALYRNILKLHRKLPKEFRYVGDGYVKQEFRQHRAVKDNMVIEQFVKSWEEYCQQLEAQVQTKNIGKRLDDLESLKDEQVAQLYELYKETREK